jgi:uncharacterized protein (DUF983 family)
VLTAVGAALAKQGYADSAVTNQIVGGGMVVVGAVWAIFTRYVTTHWLKVAVQVPEHTTLPQLATIAAATPSNVTAATVATAVTATQVVAPATPPPA